MNSEVNERILIEEIQKDFWFRNKKCTLCSKSLGRKEKVIKVRVIIKRHCEQETFYFCSKCPFWEFLKDKFPFLFEKGIILLDYEKDIYREGNLIRANLEETLRVREKFGR